MSKVLRSPLSVFSLKELGLVLEGISAPLLRRRVNYYVKKGELYPVRRGIYAKDQNYDKLELAVRLYSPAYISFETVLNRSSILFSSHAQISIASYLTRKIKIGGQVYSFRKIKDEILNQAIGIEKKESYYIAIPERAFLDLIYLSKDFYFDNLTLLNWEKVFEILPIYKNIEMEKRVKKYFEEFKKS